MMVSNGPSSQILLLLLSLSALCQGMMNFPSTRYAVAEHLFVDTDGLGLATFDSPLMPGGCRLNNATGEVKGAEWIRTSFHDAIVHDAETGLYGVDGSVAIHAEQARPENGGVAIPATTVGAGLRCVNAALGMADCIALGLVAAAAQCGGVVVDLRLGRIDAESPTPSGVPEPQDSTKSLITAMAKAGLTLEESITLISCGHGTGGVHANRLPGSDIVPASSIQPDNTTGNNFFDDTPNVLDQGNIKDYVYNTGRRGGPLVHPMNATFNSDARMFSSDKNNTVKLLAAMSPEDYRETCGKIFERMINLVPGNVKLGEVIAPLDTKPTNTTFDLNSNGNLILHTAIRLITKNRPAPRQVAIKFTTRHGRTTEITTHFEPNNTASLQSFFGPTQYYEFTIDLGTDSTDAFEVEADGFSTSSYDLQPDLFYSQSMSSLQPSTTENTATLNIVAAVSMSVKSMFTTVNIPTPQNGTDTPRVVRTEVQMNYSKKLGQYLLYEGSMSKVNTTLLTLATVDIHADFGDGKTLIDDYNQLAFLQM